MVGGAFDLDDKDHRLKYRIQMAEVILKVLRTVGATQMDVAAASLGRVCGSPSSTASLRACLKIVSEVRFSAQLTAECLRQGLRSEEGGVLKEAGQAIQRSGSRIVAEWTGEHMSLLSAALRHNSWMARAALARGLYALVSAGRCLDSDNIVILLGCLCDRHSTLDEVEALVRQGGGIRCRKGGHRAQGLRLRCKVIPHTCDSRRFAVPREGRTGGPGVTSRWCA
jgi:hypothetical protein